MTALENINAYLKVKLLQLLPTAGQLTVPIVGLELIRCDASTQVDICCCAPAISIMVQGHKEITIGNETFGYGELGCLVNGVDISSTCRAIASPESPLLAILLSIDKNLAIELATEISPLLSSSVPSLGVSVSKVTVEVLDAFLRLIELLDKPEQLALLSPLFVREIITRVLLGPQGGALRMMYSVGSQSNQVAQAISWLRFNYMQPLHIETLAARVQMAVSTFHRQFKKVTSLSPLQFQKSLRLGEAQRLMLTENMDANNAARAVGYDNVQQFNREYKRFFGEPPHRDIKRMRQE